jgi:hypothetical protein
MSEPNPWAAALKALEGYHGLDEPTPEQDAAFEMLHAGVMRDGRTWGEHLRETGERGMPTEPGRPDDMNELRARLEALRGGEEGDVHA